MDESGGGHVGRAPGDKPQAFVRTRRSRRNPGRLGVGALCGKKVRFYAHGGAQSMNGKARMFHFPSWKNRLLC